MRLAFSAIVGALCLCGCGPPAPAGDPDAALPPHRQPSPEPSATQAPARPPEPTDLRARLAELMGGASPCNALDLVSPEHGLCGPPGCTEAGPQCRRKEAAILHDEMTLAVDLTVAIAAVGTRTGIPSFAGQYVLAITKSGHRAMFGLGTMEAHPGAFADQIRYEFERPELAQLGGSPVLQLRFESTRTIEVGEDIRGPTATEICNAGGYEVTKRHGFVWCTTERPLSCRVLSLGAKTERPMQLECDGPTPPWATQQMKERARQAAQGDYRLELASGSAGTLTIRRQAGTPPATTPVGSLPIETLLSQLPMLKSYP